MASGKLVFSKLSTGSGKLVFGVESTEEVCVPDWSPQSGDNLLVNFEACGTPPTTNNEWVDSDSGNLEFDLKTLWSPKSSDSLEIELNPQTGKLPPDWSSVNGLQVNIDIDCCKSGELLPISGTANTLLVVHTEAEGELGSLPTLEGNGSTSVEIFTLGSGLSEVFGQGVTSVSISTIGTGAKEKFGESSTLVTVATSGTGTKELWGNGDTLVSIESTGSGYKELWGDGSASVSIEVSGSGSKENYGNSSISVAVDATGTGTKETYGNGTTPVVINVSSNGYKSNIGFSSVTVSVGTTGEAVKIKYGFSYTVVAVDSVGEVALEKYLNSDVFVEVLSAGDGWKQKYGYSDSIVEIETEGNGWKSLWGYSRIYPQILSSGQIVKTIYGNGVTQVTLEGLTEPIGRGSNTVSIESYGVAQRSGGLPASGFSSIPVSVGTSAVGRMPPEIKGDIFVETFLEIITYGTNIFYPTVEGEGKLVTLTIGTLGSSQLLDDNYADGRTNFVQVLTSGTAVNSGYMFEEIFGRSEETFVEILSDSFADIPQKIEQDLLIPAIFEPELAIRIKIDFVVDIENQVYEIRNVETNREYLELYGYEFWRKELVLGDSIKDLFRAEEPYTDYYVEKDSTIRKYGSSELSLYIEIYNTYKFVKNPVNIYTLIDKEVDRFILDTYALYEFEYE